METMHVRDYEESDLFALKEIHRANGFDYKMPDLSSDLVLTKKVVVDDDGKILGACYTKLQTETFLLLDPSLGPAEKVEAINEVDGPVSSDSYEKGLEQQVAYLPPGIEAKFQKRLNKLGWTKGRPNWQLWVKDLV